MNELPPPPQPEPAKLAPHELTLPAVVATALTVAAFLTGGAFMQVCNVPVGLWFTELAIFLAVPMLTLKAFKLDPVRTTGFDTAFAPGIGYGLVLGAVNFFGVAAPLQWVAIQLFPKSLVQLFDASLLFRNLSGFELWVTVGAVSLAAPLCEEVAFRGLINRALLQWMKPWAAVLAGGFIFSFFHFDPVGFVARWELGALFGWLAWRSGSIWPGIAAHAGNNLTSMVLYLLSPDDASAAGDAKQVGAMFVTFGLVLSVLLQLPRRFPRLLDGPKKAETIAAAPLNLVAAAGLWLLGAATTASLLLVFDWRGARLGLIDATPPQVHFDDPHDRDQERLIDLRKKARRGEVPLDAYRELRRSIIRKHEKQAMPADAGQTKR